MKNYTQLPLLLLLSTILCCQSILFAAAAVNDHYFDNCYNDEDSFEQLKHSDIEKLIVKDIIDVIKSDNPANVAKLIKQLEMQAMLRAAVSQANDECVNFLLKNYACLIPAYMVIDCLNIRLAFIEKNKLIINKKDDTILKTLEEFKEYGII